MFGLARPAQQAKSSVRAATCALCEALSRRFGLLARLLVNYDLALLLLATQEILAERHSRFSLAFRERVDRAAVFLAALAVYYAEMHWRDKREDAGSRWARLILWFFSRTFRKARRLLDQAGLAPSLLDAEYARQLELERHFAEHSPETFAEPTATGAALACERLLASVGAESDWLVALGRAFGAALYWADAAVDYDRDRRRGEFNALAAAGLMARDGAAFALAAVEQMQRTLREAKASARAALSPTLFDDMPQNIAWIREGLDPFSFWFDQRQLFRRGLRAWRTRPAEVGFVAFASSLWQSESGVNYDNDCCFTPGDKHCCSGWVDHHAGWCCNVHKGGTCCPPCGSLINFVVFAFVAALGAAMVLGALMGGLQAFYGSGASRATKAKLTMGAVALSGVGVFLYLRWRDVVATLDRALRAAVSSIALGYLSIEHRAAVPLTPLGLWALYGFLAGAGVYLLLHLLRLEMRRSAILVPGGLLVLASVGLALTPGQRTTADRAVTSGKPDLPAASLSKESPSPREVILFDGGDFWLMSSDGSNVRQITHEKKDRHCGSRIVPHPKPFALATGEIVASYGTGKCVRCDGECSNEWGTSELSVFGAVGRRKVIPADTLVIARDDRNDRVFGMLPNRPPTRDAAKGHVFGERDEGKFVFGTNGKLDPTNALPLASRAPYFVPEFSLSLTLTKAVYEKEEVPGGPAEGGQTNLYVYDSSTRQSIAITKHRAKVSDGRVIGDRLSIGALTWTRDNTIAYSATPPGKPTVVYVLSETGKVIKSKQAPPELAAGVGFLFRDGRRAMTGGFVWDMETGAVSKLALPQGCWPVYEAP